MLLTASTLIDVVIAFTALEMLGLWAWHRFTGRGLALRLWLPNLLAGLALMLALRALASDAGWHWVIAALLGSALAHALDLRQRWPRTP